MRIHTCLHSFIFSLLLILLSCLSSHAADVLIVADSQLKPVMEFSLGLRKTLRASTRIYAPGEVKGRLAEVVKQEEAQVVIAMGKAALLEALTLPPSIPVIYDMVVIPLPVSRPNTAGFYMATPAGEYAAFVHTYLPSLKRIAAVASREYLNVLASDVAAPVNPYSIKNSVEFVRTVRQLDNADAILLLPDSEIMTSAAMEEAYLQSFRKRIPLLGISERHVKEGALLALVVDMTSVGRTIGELASKALKSGSVGQPVPLPSRKFELFLNLDTARKMRITIPDEVVRMARKAYP